MHFQVVSAGQQVPAAARETFSDIHEGQGASGSLHKASQKQSLQQLLGKRQSPQGFFSDTQEGSLFVSYCYYNT